MGNHIRDTESMSEEPQSFDTFDWEMYAEPCPICGGTEFMEESVQSNVVECDENGEPEEFRPYGDPETLKVWCRECDNRLF